jgi:hypothetical protein
MFDSISGTIQTCCNIWLFFKAGFDGLHLKRDLWNAEDKTSVEP